MAKFEDTIPFVAVETDEEYTFWFTSNSILRYDTQTIADVLYNKKNMEGQEGVDNLLDNLCIFTPKGGVILQPYVDTGWKSKYPPDYIISGNQDPNKIWSYVDWSSSIPLLTMKNTTSDVIGYKKIPKVSLKSCYSWRPNEGFSILYKLLDKPVDLELKDERGQELDPNYAEPKVYVYLILNISSQEAQKAKTMTIKLLLECSSTGEVDVIFNKIKDTGVSKSTGKRKIQLEPVELSDELATKERTKYLISQSAVLKKRKLAGMEMNELMITFIDGAFCIGSSPLNHQYNPTTINLGALRQSTISQKLNAQDSIISSKEVVEKFDYQIIEMMIGVKFASAVFAFFPVKFKQYGRCEVGDTENTNFLSIAKYYETTGGNGTGIKQKVRASYVSKEETNESVNTQSITVTGKKDTEKIKISLYEEKDKKLNFIFEIFSDSITTPAFYCYEACVGGSRITVKNFPQFVIYPASLNFKYDMSGYNGTFSVPGRQLINGTPIVDLFRGILPVTIYFGRIIPGTDFNVIKQNAKFFCGENITPGNLDDMFSVVRMKAFTTPVSVSRGISDTSVDITFKDRACGLREEVMFMLPIYDGWFDVSAIRDILSRTYFGDNLIIKFKGIDLLSYQRKGPNFRLSYGTMKQPLWMFQEGIKAWEALDKIAKYVLRMLIPWSDGRLLYADWISYDNAISGFDPRRGNWTAGIEFKEVKWAYKDGQWLNPENIGLNYTEMISLNNNVDYEVIVDDAIVMGVTPLAVPRETPEGIVWEINFDDWRILTGRYPGLDEWYRRKMNYHRGWAPWRKLYFDRDPIYNNPQVVDTVAYLNYLRNFRPLEKISLRTLGRVDLFPLMLFEVLEPEGEGKAIQKDEESIGLFANRKVFRAVGLTYNFDGKSKTFETIIDGERVFGGIWEYVMEVW